MGIPTLISTSTSSNAASASITSGIDSTYDEYMFVLVNINPATRRSNFEFQVNAASQSGYNETITSTAYTAYHYESGSDAGLSYATGADQAEGTAFQHLATENDNEADSNISGIIHLFSPSNTTYVKHFYARTSGTCDASDEGDNPFTYQYFVAGYINVTAAITDIQFKCSSGNFDCVIQMYGIA